MCFRCFRSEATFNKSVCKNFLLKLLLCSSVRQRERMSRNDRLQMNMNQYSDNIPDSVQEWSWWELEGVAAPLCTSECSVRVSRPCRFQIELPNESRSTTTIPEGPSDAFGSSLLTVLRQPPESWPICRAASGLGNVCRLEKSKSLPLFYSTADLGEPWKFFLA